MGNLPPRNNDLGVHAPAFFDQIPWTKVDRFGGSVEYKLLRVCIRDNTSVNLSRFSTKVHVTPHRHFGSVHAITFKGRWHYAEYDWVATAGSYVVEAGETEHTLVIDEDGTEVMFIVQGGMVYLGPNREVLGYDDAQMVLDRHLEDLRVLGRSLHPGVLVD